MKTEKESVFRFYEGPKFTEPTHGPFQPWLQYALREEELIDGQFVCRRHMGYFEGKLTQIIVDLKLDILNSNLPEPSGVISIKEMVDWVNRL